MIHYAEVAVVFLAILSVLVATHEYGHYIVARAFGMGVEEFSIGMFGGKPLFTYLKRTYRIRVGEGEDPSVSAGENNPGAALNFEGQNQGVPPVLIDTAQGQELEETTLFTIRPIPIGGFVRIKGMMPAQDGSEVRVPGGFYSKPPWQRFLVLLAGPAFSVIAGVIVMIPVIMLNGTIKGDNRPVLGTVQEGPASKAGLRTDDRIVSIDGQSINNFYQIISKVQNSAGVPLHFIYERNGKQTETSVTPMLSPEPTLILGPDLEATGELSRHGMLMVQPLTHRVETNFAGAVREACNLPIATVRGLMGILKRPSTAKSVVGGPGTMVQATSDAVSDGVFGVISVAAMISISVGIFNLLPVHPLDGGQMVVAFAEMLRGGRRLSFQVQNIVGAMGLATVLLLVVCALTLDVSRFRSPQPKPKIISEQKADR